MIFWSTKNKKCRERQLRLLTKTRSFWGSIESFSLGLDNFFWIFSTWPKSQLHPYGYFDIVFDRLGRNFGNRLRSWNNWKEVQSSVSRPLFPPFFRKLGYVFDAIGDCQFFLRKFFIFRDNSWFSRMLRFQQGPAEPPPIKTRFEIVNQVYNDPFYWRVFKNLILFSLLFLNFVFGNFQFSFLHINLWTVSARVLGHFCSIKTDLADWVEDWSCQFVIDPENHAVIFYLTTSQNIFRGTVKGLVAFALGVVIARSVSGNFLTWFEIEILSNWHFFLNFLLKKGVDITKNLHCIEVYFEDLELHCTASILLSQLFLHSNWFDNCFISDEWATAVWPSSESTTCTTNKQILFQLLLVTVIIFLFCYIDILLFVLENLGK